MYNSNILWKEFCKKKIEVERVLKKIEVFGHLTRSVFWRSLQTKHTILTFMQTVSVKLRCFSTAISNGALPKLDNIKRNTDFFKSI